MSDTYTDHGVRPRWLRAIFASDANLTAEESASTVFRFFRSKHVGELRLIFYLGLVGVTFSLGLFVGQIVVSDLHPELKASLKPLSTYAGPLLTLFGVVIAWAYRSASARLGVVDLFACEITTLCRVGTILQVGKRYVQMYEEHLDPVGNRARVDTASAAGVHASENTPITAAYSDQSAQGMASPRPYTFVSEEQYFPVFDTNARDLQLLEARIVSRIVEFYTYMKATRDLMRKLAGAPQFASRSDLRISASSQPIGPNADTQQEMIINVIFMLFLAYESARKSVDDLVEFKPDKIERQMVILITELRCYALLMKRFVDHDDLRCKRLHLRESEYKDLVPKLLSAVRSETSQTNEKKDWSQAHETVKELEDRYRDVFGDVPEDKKIPRKNRWRELLKMLGLLRRNAARSLANTSDTSS